MRNVHELSLCKVEVSAIRDKYLGIQKRQQLIPVDGWCRAGGGGSESLSWCVIQASYTKGTTQQGSATREEYDLMEFWLHMLQNFFPTGMLFKVKILKNNMTKYPYV